MRYATSTKKIPLIYIYATASILVVIIALAAYMLMSRAPANDRPKVFEQITIATNTEYVGTCSIIAALENGYFLNEGLQVRIQSHSSGKAAMEAVLQGQAHLGTVADIPIMFAGLDNRPILVIATIFKAEKDHGIVGRKDRGVTTPASLKGKHIGVTQGTSAHFTLDAFLNRQKLNPDDVTKHNYKPEELSKALEKGEVDAVAGWEPFLGNVLTQLGSNGIAFNGQDVYESLYAVVGVRDYVSKHSETIKKTLRALALGGRFCNQMPEAARKLVDGMIKTDTKNLADAWPSYRFDLALDQGLLLALEDEARWAIKNKLTNKTATPNYLDYIYLDGLEAVKPSTVTIIH